MIIKSNYQSTAFVTYVVVTLAFICLAGSIIRHSPKVWRNGSMLRVIYKKNRTEPAVFFKTEPKPKPNRTRGFYQNRTETEPNLKNPFRTSLLLTHFQNSFTVGLSSDCVTIWSLKIPSHQKFNSTERPERLYRECLVGAVWGVSGRPG